MKKEKNLKNVNSKEKEKKEIPGIVKLLNAVELALIVIPLVRLGLIIIFALLTIASGEGVNINEISQELFAGTKMINATIDDEDLTSLAMCLSCAGYIVNIKIINTIKKVIINFYEDKTPFSEKNNVLLSSLKKYFVYNFITLCLGNVFGINLVAFIVVITLISVYEHGYILQQEVDEIL